MNMEAKSKWSCIKCDVPIPYNPQFNITNTMCSHCAPPIIMPINYWGVIGGIRRRNDIFRRKKM